MAGSDIRDLTIRARTAPVRSTANSPTATPGADPGHGGKVCRTLTVPSATELAA